jgi:uncharacterized protein (TIGR00255 family)
MTGYGKSEICRNEINITVEIKTVNNRYSDLNCKMPRLLLPYEDKLRKIIGESISRGRIDVYVNLTDKSEKEKTVNIDTGLAKGYYHAAKTLAEKLDIENDFTVNSLLRIPDIVKAEEESDNLIYGEMLYECAMQALENLNAMRAAEGKALKKDISARLELLKDYTDKIKERAPLVAEDYKAKLLARINEALKGVAFDEARLLSEVAFFADKSNIDEEIARLYSHYEQAKTILKDKTPAGRKLDFLVQELNREVNTICSKSSDIIITNYGLKLKAEIEKIREQVQNVE